MAAGHGQKKQMKLNQIFKINFKVVKGVCNGEIDTFSFPCALFAHVCVHYLIRRNKTRSSFDPGSVGRSVGNYNFSSEMVAHAMIS